MIRAAAPGQVNLVRTSEQILGIAPMNQMDTAAEAMRDGSTNNAGPAPPGDRPADGDG